MNIDHTFKKFMEDMCIIQQQVVMNYMISQGEDKKIIQIIYDPDFVEEYSPKRLLDKYNIRYIRYEQCPGKFELHAGNELLFKYDPGKPGESTTGEYTYNSKYYGKKVES